VTLQTPGAFQWQIITLFYAALHRVEAAFATLNLHNENHQAREEAMSSIMQFQPVSLIYRQLRDDSENARYRGWQPRANEVRQDAAYYNVLISYLQDSFRI
jgi:hypothetical protein